MSDFTTDPSDQDGLPDEVSITLDVHEEILCSTLQSQSILLQIDPNWDVLTTAEINDTIKLILDDNLVKTRRITNWENISLPPETKQFIKILGHQNEEVDFAWRHDLTEVELTDLKFKVAEMIGNFAFTQFHERDAINHPYFKARYQSFEMQSLYDDSATEPQNNILMWGRNAAMEISTRLIRGQMVAEAQSILQDYASTSIPNPLSQLGVSESLLINNLRSGLYQREIAELPSQDLIKLGRQLLDSIEFFEDMGRLDSLITLASIYSNCTHLLSEANAFIFAGRLAEKRKKEIAQNES